MLKIRKSWFTDKMGLLLSLFFFWIAGLDVALGAENKESAGEKKQEVLGMNVSGTKDLPNVLYIVPWKSNKTQIAPPQINRLVDEVYAPVDPEVFSKQVNFYYQLTNVASTNSAQPVDEEQNKLPQNTSAVQESQNDSL